MTCTYTLQIEEYDPIDNVWFEVASYTYSSRPVVTPSRAEWLYSCDLVFYENASYFTPGNEFFRVSSAIGTEAVPAVCPGIDEEFDSRDITHACYPEENSEENSQDPYYATIWNPEEPQPPVSSLYYTCTCPYYSGQVTSLSDTAYPRQNFNSSAPYFRYQQRVCKHVMAAMRVNGDLSDADVPYDETVESQFYENLNTTRYLQSNPFIIPLQVCSPEYVDELMEELEETSTNPPVRDAGTDWHNWDQSQSFGKWGGNWDSAGKF